MTSIKEFERTTPQDIVSALKVRASRSDYGIDITRLRDATELEIYDADHAPEDGVDESVRQRYENTEQRRYVSERVGELVGMEFFGTEGRALVFQTLKPKLQELSNLNPERMTAKERDGWNAWLRDVDAEIHKVEDWLSFGMQFFSSKQNMRLLHQCIARAAPNRNIRRPALSRSTRQSKRRR